MLALSSLVGGLALGGVYALVAAGLNMVFGVVKIINFAQGALLTLALYLVYFLQTGTSINAYELIPVLAVVMGAVGYLVQVALIDRVLEKERISQLLITFGLGMALRNGILAAFGANHRSVDLGFTNDVVTAGGVRITAGSLVAIGGSLLAVLLLWIFLERTRVGTAIRAVSQQPASAELAGIAVRRIYAVAFAVGTALTGVAACLMAPIYPIDPTAGDTFGIVAFIVVILGGLGSVFGAAITAFAVGVAQDMFATLVSAQMASAFVFGVFIVVMLVRPNGLFGRSMRVA